MNETYDVKKIKVIKVSVELNYLDDCDTVVHIKQDNNIREINLNNYGWLKDYILDDGKINKDIIGNELFAVYNDETIELFSSDIKDSRITSLLNHQNGSEQCKITPC